MALRHISAISVVTHWGRHSVIQSAFFRLALGKWDVVSNTIAIDHTFPYKYAALFFTLSNKVCLAFTSKDGCKISGQQYQVCSLVPICGQPLIRACTLGPSRYAASLLSQRLMKQLDDKGLTD